jgi:hypothetical protein
MKKLLPLILLFSCTKENPRISDEVLLTVTSECNCSIKVFQSDGSQYLSTTFDCEYIHILPLHIASGTYTIKAENGLGKLVNQSFKKGNYSQELNIDF